jgi:hypothetical protein
MTRPRGTVILKSTVHGTVAVDTAPIIVNELTLVGSRCGRFEAAPRAHHPRPGRRPDCRPLPPRRSSPSLRPRRRTRRPEGPVGVGLGAVTNITQDKEMRGRASTVPRAYLGRPRRVLGSTPASCECQPDQPYPYQHERRRLGCNADLYNVSGQAVGGIYKHIDRRCGLAARVIP